MKDKYCFNTKSSTYNIKNRKYTNNNVSKPVSGFTKEHHVHQQNCQIRGEVVISHII